MKRSILASAAILAAAGAAFADDTQVIVGFKTSADASLLAKHGGKADSTLARVKAVAGHVPASSIASLRAEPAVAYVEEDGICEAVGKPGGSGGKPAPSQPAETTPWGITRVGAPVSGNTGAGIHVAIIDTGIDLDHPDLAAHVGAGVNYVNSSNAPDDDNGHGSHVSGTIGAIDNTIGVVGVAPDCTLHPVKVLDRRGSGYWSAVAAGVSWAADNGMQVANMSIGGSVGASALEAACDSATAAGVVLCVAAGNEGDGNLATTEISYPGAYASCIAVGATASSDGLASFSNTGSWVDVSGPGVSVFSTYKGASYATLNGTSMATPHASGIAALLWGVVAEPTAASVRAELESRCQDAGPSGFDNGWGAGIVHY
jgi:subtilisin family serine protease